MQVCGQAATAAQALSQIASLKPEVVIVDISLKGTNGIELVKHIKALHPETRILVLSVHDENLYAERALRAGALGYVMKQVPVEEVMAAIRQVRQGSKYLSRRMQERMLEKLSGRASARTGAGPELAQLSDRELEVLQLIGGGSATKEIALQLRLSINTIETHRAHI